MILCCTFLVFNIFMRKLGSLYLYHLYFYIYFYVYIWCKKIHIAWFQVHSLFPSAMLCIICTVRMISYSFHMHRMHYFSACKIVTCPLTSILNITFCINSMVTFLHKSSVTFSCFIALVHKYITIMITCLLFSCSWVLQMYVFHLLLFFNIRVKHNPF